METDEKFLRSFFQKATTPRPQAQKKEAESISLYVI